MDKQELIQVLRQIQTSINRGNIIHARRRLTVTLAELTKKSLEKQPIRDEVLEDMIDMWPSLPEDFQIELHETVKIARDKYSPQGDLDPEPDTKQEENKQEEDERPADDTPNTEEEQPQ